jgi:cytochrome c553
MRLRSLHFALPTGALAMVLSAAALGGKGAPASSKYGLQAKLEYCKTCHGLSGEGYRGYFAMPRLAGQQSVYTENQLRAFVEHRRTNTVMLNVARALSPDMISALAEHFRNLDARPIGGASKERVAAGKTIYEEGLSESNIPACAACHSPDAKGQGEIPRLAGQLYPYTIKVLTNWSKERGQGGTDSSTIMVATAHNLSQSQVAAVAAYVSDLK